MADLLGHGRTQIGDERVRHVLEERWGPGPVLGAIGMNPSHASDERSDMTWNRWSQFGRRWGFGGLIAVNPCPLRSATPHLALAALRRAERGEDADMVQALNTNISCLRQVGPQAAAWLCAWGDGGDRMDEAMPGLILRTLLALKGNREFVAWLAFGLTQGGAPKHVMARGTSRIADDAPVYAFDPFNGRRLLGPFDFTRKAA